MGIISNCLACVKGNIVCFFKKMLHGKSYKYSPYIRLFPNTSIFLRNKGGICLGKNVKIDSGAIIASNGGTISLGNSVGIGKNNIIVAQEKIMIGEGTILAPNVFVYDHDHEFDSKSGVKIKNYLCESVTIGINCWIGANTVILRGTHIGDNCLVGAGCVLKGNYPSGSKIIQKRQTMIIGEQ